MSVKTCALKTENPLPALILHVYKFLMPIKCLLLWNPGRRHSWLKYTYMFSRHSILIPSRQKKKIRNKEKVICSSGVHDVWEIIGFFLLSLSSVGFLFCFSTVLVVITYKLITLVCSMFVDLLYYMVLCKFSSCYLPLTHKFQTKS